MSTILNSLNQHYYYPVGSKSMRAIYKFNKKRTLYINLERPSKPDYLCKLLYFSMDTKRFNTNTQISV